MKFVRTERRRSIVIGCALLWTVLAAIFLSHHVIGSGIVSGESMAPTLAEGDRYLIHRWLMRIRDPVPGDIVVLRDPSIDELAVKRVVAGPGARIQIIEGRLIVDGHPLAEESGNAGKWTGPGFLKSAVYEIAPDCFFVMGDNRTNSYDSRHYGAVEKSDIYGYVLPAVTWP